MQIFTVSVYGTPMSFPLNVTLHTWIEVSDGSTIDRYDLWGYPGLRASTKRHGYIYHNVFPDHLGTTFSPFAEVNSLANRQTGKVLIKVSGTHGSNAHKLYQKITSEVWNYPYYDKYNMILGPNCNTFTAWLISLEKDTNLALPWRAWGKNYKPKCAQLTNSLY